jgi:hypothetical protein
LTHSVTFTGGNGLTQQTGSGAHVGTQQPANPPACAGETIAVPTISIATAKIA